VPLSVRGGGELGPHLTQCRLGRGLPRSKWCPDLFNRLAMIINMGRTVGGCCDVKV